MAPHSSQLLGRKKYRLFFHWEQKWSCVFCCSEILEVDTKNFSLSLTPKQCTLQESIKRWDLPFSLNLDWLTFLTTQKGEDIGCLQQLLLFSHWVVFHFFVTPRTEAVLSPLSMAFSRQCWSGLSFPSPEDCHNQGIKPMSPALRQILYHWATREASQQLYLDEINISYITFLSLEVQNYSRNYKLQGIGKFCLNWVFFPC